MDIDTHEISYYKTIGSSQLDPTLILNAAAHSYQAGKNLVRNVRFQGRNTEGIKSSGEI